MGPGCDTPAAGRGAPLHCSLVFIHALNLSKSVLEQVVVFNLYTPGNIMRALCGDLNVGTTICSKETELSRPMALRS